jgi:hypothetical protein
MANISQTEDQFLHGYAELSEFLTKNGFKIAESTLSKFCNVGKGPPNEGIWGKKKRFLASKAMAWAEDRLSGRTKVAPDEMMPPPPRAEWMPPESGTVRSPIAEAMPPDQRRPIIDIPDDELPPF